MLSKLFDARREASLRGLELSRRLDKPVIRGPFELPLLLSCFLSERFLVDDLSLYFAAALGLTKVSQLQLRVVISALIEID